MTATFTIIAVALFLFGTAWDVQWHVSVGRDRLLTAPHLLMLASIALAGLTSLATVLLKRSRVNAGVVLSGVAALLAAVAFVLDDYWHAPSHLIHTSRCCSRHGSSGRVGIRGASLGSARAAVLR